MITEEQKELLRACGKNAAFMAALKSLAAIEVAHCQEAMRVAVSMRSMDAAFQAESQMTAWESLPALFSELVDEHDTRQRQIANQRRK